MGIRIIHKYHSAGAPLVIFGHFWLRNLVIARLAISVSRVV